MSYGLINSIRPKIPTGSELEKCYQSYAQKLYGKFLNQLNAGELNNLISEVIQNVIIAPVMEQTTKVYSVRRVVAYFSIEVLLGKLVYEALINTRILETTEKIFRRAGVDISTLEEVKDTALGNGGLGRLAACYYESAATLGYNVHGFGILYDQGFFEQKFENNWQVEIPEYWFHFYEHWFKAHPENSIVVKFEGTSVLAVPYVLPIIGYEGYSNPLTLWKAVPIDGYSNEIVAKISEKLYPDDSGDYGKRLRLAQEYFMASATMQYLMGIHYRMHGNFDNFEDFYYFQMNDTHPVLSCLEFIRILQDEYGYSFRDASIKAKKCFGYTNHTVMPEALEEWNLLIFKDMIPRIFKVVEDLNQELIDYLIGEDWFKAMNPEDGWRKVREYELFGKGKSHEGTQVRMANIACYVANSINGVAKVHSEIIKESTLAIWHEEFPERFCNVTNGITPRRWLLLANPKLAAFFDKYVGEGWVTDLFRLQALKKYKDDQNVLSEFAGCKYDAKVRLANYILDKENVVIDPESIFDCQVKRFHLYKRQHMNALRILYFYQGIKSGTIKDFPNTTFIIGGKSAPTYAHAKQVIHLLKQIQDLVNNDSDMVGKMRVVVVTNFNVTYGQLIYAAADFSEQISTAGTEASGTGNMKFMANGAITIGTLDGANIEIADEAGIENEYIFGATVDKIRELKTKPYSINHMCYQLLGYLKGSPELRYEPFWDLVNLLQYNDEYFCMYDLPAYIETSERAFRDYIKEKITGDSSYFTVKSLLNTASSGKFSSDRAIREYAENIWHISPEIDVNA